MVHLMVLGMGTTSACAENTRACRYLRSLTGNYLRVRGEYKYCSYAVTYPQELPPRARRIHRDNQRGFQNLGTTSACAENTSGPAARYSGNRNYLRVRGEYPK